MPTHPISLPTTGYLPGPATSLFISRFCVTILELQIFKKRCCLLFNPVTTVVIGNNRGPDYLSSGASAASPVSCAGALPLINELKSWCYLSRLEMFASTPDGFCQWAVVRYVTIETQISVHRPFVCSLLLYGCESWALLADHEKESPPLKIGLCGYSWRPHPESVKQMIMRGSKSVVLLSHRKTC